MSGEQRLRAVLFYLSVLIFFSGLPFILSFALGYKFNRRTLKFTKTGLIVVKTQPAGANVYLNKKLLFDKTPMSINELLPGTYTVDLELPDRYPYTSEIEVEAGKVARLEKVMLFPVRPDVKKLNKEAITHFWMDETKGVIYYINEEEHSIYKSDLDGDRFEKVATVMALSPQPKKWKVSPDKEKICYYNVHQIGISALPAAQVSSYNAQAEFILNDPDETINEVFWHSDSFHLVIVGNKNIEVLEAHANSQPLALVTLNKRNTFSYYDLHTDTLYFLDTQKADDGKYYDNVYKLELNSKLYPFYELMKRTPPIEKQGALSDEN